MKGGVYRMLTLLPSVLSPKGTLRSRGDCGRQAVYHGRGQDGDYRQPHREDEDHHPQGLPCSQLQGSVREQHRGDPLARLRTQAHAGGTRQHRKGVQRGVREASPAHRGKESRPLGTGTGKGAQGNATRGTTATRRDCSLRTKGRAEKSARYFLS